MRVIRAQSFCIWVWSPLVKVNQSTKWSKVNPNHCSLNKSRMLAKQLLIGTVCFPGNVCGSVCVSICMHLCLFMFQLLPRLACLHTCVHTSLPALAHLPGTAYLCVCLCVCVRWAVSPKEGLCCCHAMTPLICCCPVKRSWRQRSGHPHRDAATQSTPCLPASPRCRIGISPSHTHVSAYTHIQIRACLIFTHQPCLFEFTFILLQPSSIIAIQLEQGNSCTENNRVAVYNKLGVLIESNAWYNALFSQQSIQIGVYIHSVLHFSASMEKRN